MSKKLLEQTWLEFLGDIQSASRSQSVNVVDAKDMAELAMVLQRATMSRYRMALEIQVMTRVLGARAGRVPQAA